MEGSHRTPRVEVTRVCLARTPTDGGRAVSGDVSPVASAERLAAGSDPEEALRRAVTMSRRDMGEADARPVCKTGPWLFPRLGGGDRSRSSTSSPRSIRCTLTTVETAAVVARGGVVPLSVVVSVRGLSAAPEDESVDIVSTRPLVWSLVTNAADNL